jgi:hypothetical protein
MRVSWHVACRKDKRWSVFIMHRLVPYDKVLPPQNVNSAMIEKPCLKQPFDSCRKGTFPDMMQLLRWKLMLEPVQWEEEGKSKRMRITALSVQVTWHMGRGVVGDSALDVMRYSPSHVSDFSWEINLVLDIVLVYKDAMTKCHWLDGLNNK